MNKWIKPLRTAVQIVVGVAAALPILVPALGLDKTAGVGATVLGVGVVVTHLMQTDAGEQLLKYLGISNKE